MRVPALLPVLAGLVATLPTPGAARAQRVVDDLSTPVATISDEALNRIPQGRDPWQVLKDLPAVQTTPDPGDRTFVVDGVILTDPGTDPSTIDLDRIRDIATGGFSAEYGGATGGVINIVTKSGTNTWRSATGGTSTITMTIDVPENDPPCFESSTLGGPLIKDKMWFFRPNPPRVDLTDLFFPRTKGSGVDTGRIPGCPGTDLNLHLVQIPILHPSLDRLSAAYLVGPGGDLGDPLRTGGWTTRPGWLDYTDPAGDRLTLRASFAAGLSWPATGDWEPTLRLDYSSGCGRSTLSGPEGRSIPFIDTAALRLEGPFPLPTGGVPGCDGQPDFRFQTTSPWATHQYFGADGPGRADLGGSANWRGEDTNVFSTNFYLSGLRSYVDGGFKLVPRSSDFPFEPARQGVFFLGLDGPTSVTTGRIFGEPLDLDGDGIPDTPFLQGSDFQTICPGMFWGAFRVQPGDGGGRLVPDPDAQPPDCDAVSRRGLLGDDRWLLRERLSLDLGIRYQGEITKSEIAGHAFGAPLQVKDRLWVWGSYDIPDVSRKDDRFAYVDLLRDFRVFTPGIALGAPGDPSTQREGLILDPIEIPGRPTGDATRPGKGGGAPGPPDPRVRIHLTSTGILGGGAMRVEAWSGEPGPVQIGGGFVVVEPVRLDAAARAALEAELASSGVGSVTAVADGYCLDHTLRLPSAGVVFRIAAPEVQRAFAPVARVVDAARRLRDAGLLHPDSDPADYFHSIRQWAVWSLREDLDAEGFAKAFVKETRKNFERVGRPWNTGVERVVRDLATNRWRDVTVVLEKARADTDAPDR